MVILNIGDDYAHNPFILNTTTIILLANYLPKFKLQSHKQARSTFDIILLPTEHICCGKIIRLDGRYHSKIIIYTEIGIITARTYHGNCKCGKKNYYDLINLRTFSLDKDIRYLLFTTGIAFPNHCCDTSTTKFVLVQYYSS